MMTAIDWSKPVYHLGVEEMDETHGEFAALVNLITETSDQDDLKLLLGKLVEHTRQHFAREEAMMRECGFRAIEEHVADHNRVLSDLERFVAMAARGAPHLARTFVSEFLPSWFETHAQTMDSALAACVKSRRRSRRK